MEFPNATITRTPSSSQSPYSAPPRAATAESGRYRGDGGGEGYDIDPGGGGGPRAGYGAGGGGGGRGEPFRYEPSGAGYGSRYSNNSNGYEDDPGGGSRHYDDYGRGSNRYGGGGGDRYYDCESSGKGGGGLDPSRFYDCGRAASPPGSPSGMDQAAYRYYPSDNPAADVPSLVESESSSFGLSSDDDEDYWNRKPSSSHFNQSYSSEDSFEYKPRYDQYNNNHAKQPPPYEHQYGTSMQQPYEQYGASKQYDYGNGGGKDQYMAAARLPPRELSFKDSKLRYNSHDSAKVGAHPSNSNNKTIEVAPGEHLRLRGADETWRAIQCDFYMPYECVCCSLTIFCIQDADFVLCPACRVVSPMTEDGISNADFGGSAEAGGVGLGFTMEDLAKWQSDIERNRKENRKLMQG